MGTKQEQHIEMVVEESKQEQHVEMVVEETKQEQQIEVKVEETKQIEVKKEPEPEEPEFITKKVWDNSTKTFKEVTVKNERKQSKSRKAKSKSESKSTSSEKSKTESRSKSKSPQRSEEEKQTRGRSEKKKRTSITTEQEVVVAVQEDTSVSSILKTTSQSPAGKKITFAEDEDGPGEAPEIIVEASTQFANVGASASFLCK